NSLFKIIKKYSISFSYFFPMCHEINSAYINLQEFPTEYLDYISAFCGKMRHCRSAMETQMQFPDRPKLFEQTLAFELSWLKKAPNLLDQFGRYEFIRELERFMKQWDYEHKNAEI
ncbi:MAG: hypothetical protein WCK09_18565, partial [Bacteroidota bacterium]